ncbi:MAG TPA: ABC transporter [Chitinophagaceae bacterium]|nr:ABC transporter [Chitinophagaceae bacterium]
MQIALDHIIPKPLLDRLSGRGSDIWNQALTFQQGEIIRIKAPSGSGKTTLIHYLYQLRKDYTGSILWDNQETFSSNELAKLRATQISIVFQDLRLFPQLTARENILLKRAISKNEAVSETQIIAMAEQLQVTHILDQPAGICSYGEQQRIAIIRALVQPFQWLLLDEPFSHLDEANTARAAKLIQEVCAQQQAGMLLTDLDDDSHFNYTKRYTL